MNESNKKIFVIFQILIKIQNHYNIFNAISNHRQIFEYKIV